MTKALTTIIAFFIALLIFTLVSQLLIFIGPILFGLIIGAFKIQSNPRIAADLEAAGNIFVFVVSTYAAVKTYKSINNKNNDTSNSNDPSDDKWIP